MHLGVGLYHKRIGVGTTVHDQVCRLKYPFDLTVEILWFSDESKCVGDAVARKFMKSSVVTET
jgi:hypothetical protein